MNAIRKISQICRQGASTLWKALSLASVIVTSTYALYEFYNKLDPNRAFWPAWVPALEYNLRTALIVFAVSLSVSLVALNIFLYCATVKIDNRRSIRVRFSDILAYKKDKGAILVGINDKLECGENEVAKGSLHWNLIRRANNKKERDKGSGPTWIETAFAEAAKAEEEAKNHSFKNPDGSYKNGYAFVAEDDEKHQFVFLVMSSLPVRGAATTTAETVCEALNKLFTNPNIAISQNRLYAPPIGTGGARLLNDRQEIAVSMAAAFAHAKPPVKQGSLPVHELVIVFRGKRFFQVNMEKLYQRIKMCAQICPGCFL